MAHRQTGPLATAERTLSPVPFCWVCRHPTRVAYHGKRQVTHLWGACCYTLVVRRCQNRTCIQYWKPIRPEEEGALALPKGTFGLDVIATVGRLRFAEQRSMRAIHRCLRARGVDLAQRSVTELVHRYAELIALPASDPACSQARRLWRQGRVVLAVDSVQYEADQPVLWVLRDVLSGTVLLARSLLRAQGVDLEALIGEAAATVPVPIAAVICTGPGASGAGCGVGRVVR